MKLVSKVKEEVTSLACAGMAEYHCNRNVYKRIFVIAMIVVMILSMAVVAFADDPPAADEGATGGGDTPTDIASLGASIRHVLEGVYDAATGILTACVCIFTVVALILRMTANQQTAAMATKWLIRVWVCYGIFLALGIIFSIIQSITNESGVPDPGVKLPTD